MQSHPIFSLLSTFTRKEMTRWVAFSLSPYHHKHRETQALVQYLDKIYPVFPPHKCDRQQIWKKLFPTKTHDQAKLALLFTYAWRLAQKFLLQEQFEQDNSYQERQLLHALRERSLSDTFTKQWSKASDHLNVYPYRDTSYYSAAVQLAQAGDSFVIQEGRQSDNRYLEAKEQALDQYYLLEKLRDAVEMQVRRKILKVEYSARLLESTLQEIRENASAYADAPAIRVYFALYVMMTEPSLVHYRQALELFQTNEACFQKEEIAAIYVYLQNFCIGRINQANEQAFLREIFLLYQDQYERQLLHEDGYLIEWHYKNIVTTAIRLQELAWVNSFIESAKAQLAPEAADNAYRFNKAAYCHAVGQYSEVLTLLIQVEYSDVRYNLGAKALLLRTYYETEAYEALHALVESFRQYLQRKENMAASRRSGYHHLFRLTRRLAALRHKLAYTQPVKAKQTLQKIEAELDRTRSIFNRQWLVDKVAALKSVIPQKE